MPRTARPKAELQLSGAELAQLTRWARRATSSQVLALRSRIVLGCAEGLSNMEVAAREGVSQPTVGKWRSRFVGARLDGLVDDPRPGRPVTVTAEQVEDVVVATLESTPRNATHWSRSTMAARSGLSPSTIGRIWKAFELKPHRADGFKLSTDPLFVEKVYDIVGLYLNPPEFSVGLDIHLVCDNYGTHKTETDREGLVAQASLRARPLHPDLFQLDQPGRAVRRLPHRRPAPTQRPPFSPGPESRHPRLDQRLEPEPRNHSSGPRPQTRSSTHSHDF